MLGYFWTQNFERTFIFVLNIRKSLRHRHTALEMGKGKGKESESVSLSEDGRESDRNSRIHSKKKRWPTELHSFREHQACHESDTTIEDE